jgi:hypothetical protein
MPARVPPTAGLYALAAPVKEAPVEEVVVGPVGVLVAEPVVIVPLLGRLDEPVPVTMLVVRVLDGQKVVVKVSVVVVEPVVITVVPVEVVVLELIGEVVEEEVVEVEPELVEEEIGVQLGRVIVPLPQPPDEQITSQFLEQAASPEVVEVCQHAA